MSPLMDFLSASQLSLWNSTPVLSDMVFCIIRSLAGGMYAPPVLLVSISGFGFSFSWRKIDYLYNLVHKWLLRSGSYLVLSSHVHHALHDVFSLLLVLFLFSSFSLLPRLLAIIIGVGVSPGVFALILLRALLLLPPSLFSTLRIQFRNGCDSDIVDAYFLIDYNWYKIGPFKYPQDMVRNWQLTEIINISQPSWTFSLLHFLLLLVPALMFRLRALLLWLGRGIRLPLLLFVAHFDYSAHFSLKSRNLPSS